MPTKKVSVWSAKKGKRVGRSFTAPTQEEADAGAEAIKKKYRLKNELYKKGLVKEKIVKYTDITPYHQVISTNNIDLKLDPETGNSTVIFGSSKRGKSTLMMHLYEKYYEQDKQFISTLFSINSHIDVYKTKIKERLLRCGVFDDKAEKYIKLEKHINMKTKNHYKFLNMFDDCIDMKYSRLMNNLILTFRNSNMSTLMCLQYTYLLSKMNRANANNIIIFGCNSHEASLDLIKVFLKPYFTRMGLKGENDMTDFYKHVTSDHGFIYIHNASDTISFHRLNQKA